MTADFHLIGPRKFDVMSLGPNLKSAVTHMKILIYYSTFIQTNVSQLQSFRDQLIIMDSMTIIPSFSLYLKK